MLFNHKKEWGSGIYYDMEEPWRNYANWNKPDIKGQILYDFTYKKYLE
jgi:hypothetical protein